MNDALIQVHPDARIGRNVTLSPFTTIAAHVEIGDDCWIGPNVTIFDYVRLGKSCRVFPGAVLGAIPQDLKFQGEESWVEIGDGTTVRECATVHRGTAASGKYLTHVGENCLLMAYSHVAHDCHVGDHCILASLSALAGEVVMEDWAIVSGGTVVHQFCRIGAHAMVGGASGVSKDIPPFTITARNPAAYAGLNLVGLRRRGFSEAEIGEISHIYKLLYNRGLNVSDACAAIRQEMADSPIRTQILDFVEHSQRGIVR